jgi:hypothetical protein
LVVVCKALFEGLILPTAKILFLAAHSFKGRLLFAISFLPLYGSIGKIFNKKIN